MSGEPCIAHPKVLFPFQQATDLALVNTFRNADLFVCTLQLHLVVSTMHSTL